jgi:hypothetical protein
VAAALSKWLVENGGETWRHAHPALVFRFAGMDAILRPRMESDSSIDRRTVDSKSAEPVAAIDRPSGSGKTRIGKNSNRGTVPAPQPVASAPVAASAPKTSAEAVSTPAASMSSGAAGTSNPKWIAAPPSAPLAAPPLPTVVSTSPNNRIDRRVIYIAAMVLGAVLLITGVGYKLIAGSDEGQPEKKSEATQSAPGVGSQP